MSNPWTKLRWVSLIPAVGVGAIAIREHFFLVGKATLWVVFGPMHFLSRLFVECLALALIGAGTVLIATVLAPKHKRFVSALVSLVGILFAAYAGAITFGQHDYWAVASCIGMAMGSVSAYYLLSPCFLAPNSSRLPTPGERPACNPTPLAQRGSPHCSAESE